MGEDPLIILEKLIKKHNAKILEFLKQEILG